MSYIAPLLNEENLRQLAGPRFYERGVNYAAEDRVERLYRGPRAVEAIVRGTRGYRIELWVEDGVLSASCTCPVGEDGLFCKHCVATGLVAMEGVMNGAGAETNGASVEANGASAEANGASAGTNGSGTGTNGSSAEANGSSAEANGSGA